MRSPREILSAGAATALGGQLGGESPYERAQASARVIRAQRVGAAIFAVLFARLAILQVVQSTLFRRISEVNRVHLLFAPAARGMILDRHGLKLADSRPAFVAVFRPGPLEGPALYAELDRLAALLEVDPTRLRRQADAEAGQPLRLIRLADDVPRDRVLKLLELRADLAGLDVQVEARRVYPQGGLASHVLGYLGEVDARDLRKYTNEGYRTGEWIGKSGLERVYERELRGQSGGQQIEVDAKGRQLRVLQEVEPRPGSDLTLTLDMELQAEAERALAGRRGAAVMMDPNNGEILVLASSPGFDPNAFLDASRSSELHRVLVNPASPFMNRAIQGLYPPGSTFKIVTTAAGLEERKLDPREPVTCRGGVRLGHDQRIFRCWLHRGHQSVTFLPAFANSCDVYYYLLGLRLGSGVLHDYARMLGYGEPTGVDLGGEPSGTVPDAEWKMVHRRQAWFDGDLANFSIGQGDLQTTPIQVAAMAGAIATGGTRYTPRLVLRAGSGGTARDTEATVRRRFRFSETTLSLLREGLERVVREGTGRAAAVQGLRVAGKTGSSETGHGLPHAWFCGYAPADAPRVAFAVVVEAAGHGGSVAAPIARRLVARALGVEDIRAGESRSRAGAGSTAPTVEIGD